MIVDLRYNVSFGFIGCCVEHPLIAFQKIQLILLRLELVTLASPVNDDPRFILGHLPLITIAHYSTSENTAQEGIQNNNTYHNQKQQNSGHRKVIPLVGLPFRHLHTPLNVNPGPQ